MTQVNSGTVFGQALGLESDGTEELRMPGCVSIADHHENPAEVALVKMCQQPLSNTRWMMGGHHVFEEVATHIRETPELVLSVRTREGLCGQHDADEKESDQDT